MPDLDYSGLAPVEPAQPPPVASAPAETQPPTLDFSGLKPLDYSGLQPVKLAAPADTGFLAAAGTGLLRGSAEVGQTGALAAGETPTPLPEENTVAAQPPKLSDIWSPKQLAEKAVYQFARNFPGLTGGIAGGVAGTALEGGVPGPGTLIGGGLGMAFGTAFQRLGPEFAQAIKENPKDPDAAFNTALTRTATQADIAGVSWGLFGWQPFSGTVKNMLFQAFGVQPAVTAGGTAVENVVGGRPVGQGVAESIPGAVVGTLTPMAGHAAIPYATAAARRVFGAAAPAPAAGGAPGGPGATAPGTGPTPAGGAPAGPGATPPETMPPPGTGVNVQGIDQPLTVKGYRGDLVDLEDANGTPHLMKQADFTRLHTVVQPTAAPSSPEGQRLLPPPETIYGPGQPWASTGEGMIPGTPGFTMRPSGTNEPPTSLQRASNEPPAAAPVTLADIDRWATEEHQAQASGAEPTPAEHVTSPIEQAVEAATKPAADLLALPAPQRMLPRPATIYGEGFTAQPPEPLDAMAILKARLASDRTQPLGASAPAAPPPLPIPAPAPTEVPTAPEEPRITVEQPKEQTEPSKSQQAPLTTTAPANVPTVTQEKHTKTGADIYAVRFPQKPDVDGLGAQAKKLGGYWSSFRGGGMQPGWMFKTPDAASRFADWALGKVVPAAPSQAEAPASPPHPPPTPPQAPSRPPGWEEIGKNYIGQTVYEDQRGVRSLLDNKGIRHTEPVGMAPTREGPQVSVRAPADKDPEYQVATPHPARPGQAIEYQAPAPTREDHDLAHLNTPQDMIDHVIGMIARGEPIDAAELAQRLGVSESYARDIIIPVAGTIENPALAAAETSPHVRLADMVAQRLASGAGLGPQGLQRMAEQAFGATLASGKFTRADMYDAMELGVNRYVTNHPELFSPREDLPGGQRAVKRLETLKNSLPTQTVRAGEKEAFQQFSTPPDYAYMAAWAADIRSTDSVLEPSAGTGSLVAAAHNAGPRELITNELSANRAPLVESLNPDRAFRENAEQLHNVLPADVKPTVVVMNPPFSATAGRMGDKTVLMTGARHVEQALERLDPGGRLVAIVGQGMKPFTGEAAGRRGDPTGKIFQDWWRRISQNYDVRANIGIPGSVYGKYGTTFGTRLLVIDKAAPSGRQPVTGDAASLPEAMEKLDAIRQDRPGISGQPVAAEPGGEAVARPSAPPVEPGSALPGTALIGGVRGGPPAGGTGPGIPGGPRPGIGGAAGPEPRPSGGNEVANQQPERPGPIGAEPNAPTGIGAGEVVGGGGAEPHGVVLRPEGGTGPVLPIGSEPQDIAEGHAPVVVQADEAVAEPHAGAEITESVYEPYKPQRIKIAGAKPHLGDLVQSAAMASVMPPVVDYTPRLPKELILTGALSQAQLEPIVYAGHAHSQMLPAAEGETAYRRGHFIGDGTGVGKGREIAGIILDNFLQGRKKAVWISENKTLLKDAQRDWSGLGRDSKDIFEVGKTKAGEDLKQGQGIAFLPYDTLKSSERTGKDAEGKTIKGRRRLDQLASWLGKDFDGVIAFDEAHNMANSLQVKGERGVKDASQKALAGIELQKMLPNARVEYVSATGATEVSNLAYADRLGLWGRGTPFPNKQEFISQIGRGGIAAMELVARDMKAMGHYVARNLSYDDVKYDRLEHNLSPEQRDIYDSLAEGWQNVLGNINQALLLTGAPNANTGEPRADSQQKKNALSAFWGGHQRFFNQIITSMQMPSVLRGIEGDIKEGRQAVLQLVNTNEASQSRAIAKRAAQEGAGEDLYEDLDMTPRDQLMQMIDKSFPTAQMEEYVDENGNEGTREVRDAAGNIIHNRQALALKEALLDRVGSIRVPDGPLEMAINHFGVDNVAEITGRGQRVVRKPDKSGTVRAQLETRPGSANETETNAFQNAKKKVLIFSQAGGTGRSYHAEIGTPSAGAQRSHYLIQAGWRADKAIQGFGRTHRTNQASAPIFHLVTTDLQGQRRFISSIARRLSQLGALTKGERRAGESGLFGPKDNLESREADTALSAFWRDLQGNRIEGIDSRDFEKQTGLALENKKGESTEAPEITQFLNRLLSLKFAMQNQVFGEFERRLTDAIDSAAAAGTLDVGAETYKADRIRKDVEQTVFTDPKSGAETKYVRLAADHRNHPASFAQVNNGRHRVTGNKQPLFYATSKRSGKIVAVTEGGNHTDTRTGQVTSQYRLADPLRWDYVPQGRIDYEGNWDKIEDRNQAKALWDKQVAAIPEYRSEDVHLITGAVLPIWDRLQGYPKVYRLQTDAGERMLGRVIDENQIQGVLKALGAETAGKQFTPEQVAERVLDGDQATLANGWKLKRSLVAGEPRIELTGPYYSHDAQLQANGLFKERIAYETRYFVPTGDEAPKVLARLLAEHPISEFATTARGLAEGEPGAQTPAGYRDLREDFAATPGEPHRAALDWTVGRGKATGFEHLAAYHPAEAGVTHAYTMGQPNAIGISPELDRLLDDPNASVVLHHNHPSENSLSRSDVQMVARPGVASVVAHTHGGDTFAVSASDRLRAIAQQSEPSARQLLDNLYQHAGKVVVERLQGLVYNGRVAPEEAERLYADLVNRALGASGYTNYLSSRTVDPRLTPLIKGIIRAAASAVRRTDIPKEAFDALVNRSTESVRPNQILGGLPRAAQPAAAGRPGGAEGASYGPTGTPTPGEPGAAAEPRAAPSLAEEPPPDFSDRATEEAFAQAGPRPDDGNDGNWFSRLRDNLGANPRTPAGTHKDFAVTQKNWTLPSTKGSTDPMSNPYWMATLAKHFDTTDFLNTYAEGLASWKDATPDERRELYAAMELLTLDGRDVPTDGRAIIAENRDRPLAALSKPGDIIRIESPKQIQRFGDYRRTMDQVWQNLITETARQFGWTGTPSSKAISDAVSSASSPAMARSLERAAKIVAAIEYQRRGAYLPLMRHGDYFLRVTPKAGTADKPGILGWTGDGYPPTTMFKLIDSRTPVERVMGGMRSGTPKTAQAEIDDLQTQFPEAEYDIDHGYMFAKADQMRDLDVPAIDKLMMLVGNDARGQMADRLRNTGLSAAEAKTAAQSDYDKLVDTVLDRIYEERVAGFKKPRSGVAGYDSDFDRATSDYLHWLSSYTSDLRHRPALDRGAAMIEQHPDPNTKAFWRDFDRRREDYGNELHGPLMHLRQGMFYWALGANLASTAKIMLHPLVLGLPTMTTGFGPLEIARTSGDYIAASTAILKGMRLGEQGIMTNPMHGARTPEERALVRDSELKGITHPNMADELRAMHGRGAAALTPKQTRWRQFLDAWGSNISAADRMNRGAMLLAAHRTAQRVGMDAINRVWDRDLNWKNAPNKTPGAWAQFMVNRTQGLWGDINRLPWARSQLGGMMAQFRTWEINLMSTLWQLSSRMGPAGKISASMILGGLGLLGGATALPLVKDALSAANWLYGLITDIEPDLEGSLKKAIDWLYPDAGEVVMHGPRAFGIDYGSVGFGDILSKNLQSPLDLLGAGISMPATATMRAWERQRSGQSELSVVNELMPAAVRHLIAGMYPETALASAQHGTMAMAPSQLSTADQVKMGLGFTPEVLAVHREQTTEQIHRASAFKSAVSLGEDRIANLQARGEDTRPAIAALMQTVAQGERAGILPPSEMAEVKGGLRARLAQRLHPEIPSKAMQRYQAAQPQP